MNDPEFSAENEWENPYAANEPAEPQAKPGRRPTGISVTGVMACVAGGFAILGALGGIGSLIFSKVMQAAVTPAAPPGSAAQAQLDMNRAMAAITERYMVVNFIILGVLGILGIGLLIGGIKLMKGAESGRALLVKLFLAMCLFEVVRAVPNFMAQAEMMPVMRKYMTDASQVGESPEMAGVAERVAQYSMIVGLIFGVGWVLVKIALFLWGHLYLQSSRVKAYCR